MAYGDQAALLVLSGRRQNEVRCKRWCILLALSRTTQGYVFTEHPNRDTCWWTSSPCKGVYFNFPLVPQNKSYDLIALFQPTRLLHKRRRVFTHNIYLRCFHLSGNRMIATDIDGLSCGEQNSGVALGYDIRDYASLHVSAFDFPGNSLMIWCQGWMRSDFCNLLQSEDWSHKGQLPGVHAWAPPPTSVLIVLKELARSCHKCPHIFTHVVLIPRTYCTRKNGVQCLKRKWTFDFLCNLESSVLALCFNL